MKLTRTVIRILLVSLIGSLISVIPINLAAAACPGAPTITSITSPGSGQLLIYFTAPAGATGIRTYEYNTAGGTGQFQERSTGTTESPILITQRSSGNAKMTDGTTYSIVIRAITSAVCSGSSYAGTSSTAVNGVPGVLSAPLITSVTPGDRQLTVNFNPPSTSSTSTIYYQYTLDNGVTWLPAIYTNGVTASPITLTGLTNGTSYSIKIRGYNSVAAGTASSAVSGIPIGTPNPPTNVKAVPGNAQVSLTWVAPTNNGGSGITGYKIEYLPSGGDWTIYSANTQSSSTSATITGLTSGQSYVFRVSSINAFGPSDPSSSSGVVIPGSPSPPSITAISPSVGTPIQLSVSYSAPATDGGAPITTYVYSTDGGTTWKERTDGGTTSSPLVISSTSNTSAALAIGTPYNVLIRAVNLVGQGGNSNQVTATPLAAPTVPSAPTINAITPANAQLTVQFDPASDGGATITKYQYSTDNGSTWKDRTDSGTDGSPLVITVLSDSGSTVVNGTTYQIRLRAVNSVGNGSQSNAISGTPANVPGAPTSVSGTSGNTSVYLSWVAPASNGGSEISGYKVEYLPSGGSWTTAISDTGNAALTFTVTGLTNGTSYTFRVSALNIVGTSSASTASSAITPATSPSAPTISTITPGDKTLTVTFTSPTSDGGSAISSYEFSTNSGTDWWRLNGITSSPLTITVDSSTGFALVNGTSYTLRIRAVNSVSSGTASNSISATPSASSTTPGAPTSLTATSGNGQVALSWTAPTSDGGSAITDYVVQYKLASSGTWLTFADGTSTSTTATVTGLTNNSSYNFQVFAKNTNGNSASASNTATATPAATVPGAPTGVTATVTNSTTVSIAYTAPASNGGATITSYTATSSPGGVTATVNTASSGTISVTGLTPATAYTFTVVATNSVGNSAASSASASVTTTADVPGAPTAVTGVRGNSQVFVSWTAPESNGGSSITDYVVEYAVNGTSSWSTFADGTSTSTSAVVTGLTNGTAYIFRVSATNSTGTSTPSTASSAYTPATVPNAPTSLSATVGDGSITISFTPGTNGGSAITNYKYSTGGSYTALSPADSTSPITITGLTGGTSYTITLKAVNALGDSLASDSITATPATVPDAPTSVSGTRGNTQVALSWSAPSSDGGSSITGYKVEYLPSGGSWAEATANTGSSSTSYTVTGLTNGTSYTFRVYAISAIGTSSASTVSSSYTPATVPGAPTSVTATATGSTTATVSYTAPVSNGGSTITYYTATSSPGGITATVYSATSGTISITGLTHSTTYTFTVIAHNAVGDSVSSSASNSITTSVVKSSQSALTITTTSGTYGTTMTLATTGGSSGETVTYAITGSGSATGCSITGAVLTVTKAGTCLITATMPGNATYDPVSSSQTTYTVNKASRSINATAPSTKKAGSTIEVSDLNPSVTLEAGESLSIAVSTTDACSNGSGVVSVVKGVGTCAVVLSVPESDNYLAATTSAITIPVDRADRTLTVSGHSASYSSWKNSAPTLLASDSISSADSKTYAKATDSVGCEVDSSTGAVTFVGAGTCKIVVSVGQSDVANSTTKTVSFTIGKANRTLSVTGHSASYSNWAVEPFNLTGTLSEVNSHSKSFSLAAGSVGCTVTPEGLVTITGGSGSGYCKITASSAATDDYDAASETIQFQIGRKNHSVNLDDVDNNTIDVEQTLPAKSSEDVSVSLSASPSDVCIISGGKVKGIAFGDCTVTATYAATNDYTAISTTKTIAIGRGNRTISINSGSYSASGYASWDLSAPSIAATLSADISDSKTYSLDTDSKGCSVNESTGAVTFTGGSGAGYCRIKVTAAQTSRFNAATSSTIQFQIGPRSHSVSLSSISDAKVDDEQDLPASSNRSQSLSYASDTPLICTISGGKVKAVSVGLCTISASFSANDDYQSIAESKSFTISEKTSSSSPTTTREPRRGNSENSETGQNGKNPILTNPDKKPENAKKDEQPALIPNTSSRQESNTPIISIKGGRSEDIQLFVISNTATLKGENWNLAIVPANSSSKDVEAALSGNVAPTNTPSRLEITTGTSSRTAGTGYKPNSVVSVYIFSDPLFLGNLLTDENGTFDGSILIPDDFRVGDHTLQFNGTSMDDELRTTSIAVAVLAKNNAIKFKIKFGLSGSWLNTKAYETLRKYLSQIPASAQDVAVVATGFVQNPSNQLDAKALGKARAKSVISGLKKLGLKATYSAKFSKVISTSKNNRKAEVLLTWR